MMLVNNIPEKRGESFTADDEAAIIELRDKQHWKWSDIALHIHRTEWAVKTRYYKKLRNKNISEPTEVKKIVKGKYNKKPWTLREEIDLMEAHKSGMVYREIAELLGRSRASIFRKIKELNKPITEEIKPKKKINRPSSKTKYMELKAEVKEANRKIKQPKKN